MRHTALLFLGLALATCCNVPVALYAQRAPRTGRGIPTYRETGNPFQRYFSPNEDLGQNAQTWSVAQDYRGLIYVATAGGIVEYDGVSWQPINLPNNQVVRCLVTDSSGVLYVGAEGDFGKLIPNPAGKGEMIFFSLKNALPEEARGFANIWSLHCYENKIYINAGSHIVVFSESGATVIKAQRPENFHTAFLVNGTYYVREFGVGLQKLVVDKLQLVPGGELFAEQRVDAMVPYSNNTLLIATRKMGMLLSDGSGFMPFNSPVAAYLDTCQVYHGTALRNDLFAFSTLRGGVVIVNKKGEIVKTFSRESGLADNNCHYVLQDRQGSLWLALNRGVTHIEWPGPFSLFGDAQGLVGTVNGTARFKGRLYAATTSGLFYLAPSATGVQPARFKPVRGQTGPGITTQVWSLLSIKGQLLAATTQGLFSYDGTQLRKLAKDNLPAYYLATSADSSVVYLGKENGLYLLRYRAGSWQEAEKVPEIEDDIRWVHLGADKRTLWAGNYFKGVSRIRFAEKQKPEVTHFDTTAGLPSLNYVEQAVIDGEDFFLTGGGLHAFDEASGKFRRSTKLKEFGADKGRTLKFMRQTAQGDVWLYSYGLEQDNTRGHRLAHFLRLADGGYDLERTPMQRIKNFVVKFGSAFFDADSVMWLGGDDGVLRIDNPMFKPYVAEYRSLVRAVITNDTTLRFQGAYSDTSRIAIEASRPVLSFSENAIRFDCGATSYDDPKALQYQYQLVPYETKPSAWVPEPTRNYTNLNEGEYTFYVRTRNGYSEGGSVASYSFVILPPWYRTWWAFMLYAIGAVLVVYGIVIWRLRRLQEANRILEQKVKERTAEVVWQKDEIELKSVEIKQKNAELENAYEEIRATNENLEYAYHEIEEKNKDITDSITYAKRIQEAFLPSEEEVRQYLPECFILFRPKDIVSGDFYWFSKRGNYIFLAGLDCTGHGVPGGFMSMMGNALLNDIVLQGGRTEPGVILEELHTKVQTTLKQNMPGAKTKDGMECALWRIDVQKRELAYANAMRPIMHLSKGHATELHVDKLSIGGTRYGAEENFSILPAMQYEPGDCFYTFTDGYGDQFGGDRGKKFMVKNLKDLIVEIHAKPMDEQREILDARITEWMGERHQVDDILVIGVRLP